MLPDTLDVRAALIYFHAYMYGPYRGRLRLFRDRGLQPRMVMSEDWEVFTSILLRQQGVASREGPDLGDVEVKSAAAGSSFEYQYHRNSWKKKLEADRRSGHAFVWYGDDLQAVEVWYSDGQRLASHFSEWEAEEPYSRPSQQRFRKQVSAGWVREHATLLLRVRDGEAEYEWHRGHTEDDSSNGPPSVAEN
ncbi:MAG: hypothetical protein J4F98_13770 [Acidobacteria bacterium]|nr:hypothetical protein [Acidobacteriota bacterium]